jgi:hypothetical protein
MMREERIDWRELTTTADEFGMLPGLSCHLLCTEAVYMSLFAQQLIPLQAREFLVRRHWRRFEPGDERARFPGAFTVGRLYLDRFGADLASHNWSAAARAALLPFIAAASGFRWLAHRIHSGI